MGSDLALSGLVSSLDTESLIQKLLAVEARPIQLMKQRQDSLQTKSDAWRDINSRLVNLQARAADLSNKARFYGKKATNSDTTVLDASASSSSPTGTYNLTVESLAQAHVVASGVQTSASGALGQAGNPTINGKTIQVGAADSLNSIRDKINASPEIGVTASVVQVGVDQYQLLISSKTLGSVGIGFADDGGVLTGLGVLDPTTLATNDVQAAKDAVVRFGTSLTVTRNSNTLSDVIPGVTLNLKKTGTVTVTVDQDYDAAVKMARDFVDQYNSVLDLADQLSAWDEKTKKGGTLLGDPALNQLKAQLRSLATSKVPGAATYDDFSDVGITTGKYGTSSYGRLQLDETKLREALTANLDAVGQVFGVNDANVALATAGTTATASSTAAGFDAANLLNGQTSSAAWGTTGVGWEDGTPGSFPDTVTINFNQTRTIDHLTLYTLDSATQPASTSGIRDYTVEYWNGSEWKLLTSMTGNTQGTITHNFGAVSTNQIRINVTATNDSAGASRLLQVQAFQPNLGVAGRIGGFVKGYTASGTGLLDRKQQSLKKQMEDMGDSMDAMARRLELRERTMRAKFTAMETAMGRLKDQSAALGSMLQGLNQG